MIPFDLIQATDFLLWQAHVIHEEQWHRLGTAHTDKFFQACEHVNCRKAHILVRALEGHKMKVKWWESIPYMSEDTPTGLKGELPPIKREGDVIGVRSGFLGGSVLIVCLDDGRIVDVKARDVRRVESE